VDLNFMTPEKELEVTNAVKRVISQVNDGANPSESIAKIASEHKFPPDIARRMVEAFNSSKTLFMFKQSDFDRTSEFELADIRRVLREMYPRGTQEKRASFAGVPDDYSLGEREDYTAEPVKHQDVKLAEHLPSPECIVNQMFTKRASDLRSIDYAKTEAALLRNRFRDRIIKAAKYWIEGAYQTGTRQFDEVEKDVYELWGKMGKSAMDAIWALVEPRAINEKRATGPVSRRVVDVDAEPLKSIKLAVELGERCYKADRIVEEMTGEANEFWGACVDRMNKLYGTNMSKDAGLREIGDSVIKGDKPLFPTQPLKTEGDPSIIDPDEIHFLGGKLTPDKGTDTPLSVEDLSGITNTQTELELGEIKARTMLADLMISDPVISEAPEEDVIRAWNKIATLAPRAAREPAVIQFLIRKMLQQGDVLDLLDIKTLVDSEKNVRLRDNYKPEDFLR